MEYKNSYDKQYLDLVEKVLKTGSEMPCRTGDKVRKVLNAQLTHDLAEGFPALTIRPLPFKGCRVELQGFLNGITDKKWYQDTGCQYWNEWANPLKADPKDKEAQKLERDLGPIYGFQYRHFGAVYDNYDTDYTGQGVDQLADVVNTLKTNPYDRRMIINAWNPAELHKMAIPPCIYSFQFSYVDERLHISVTQRSADLILGVPTDMMFFSVLLHVMAKTVGMKPGTVCINFVDCHIYEPHFEKAEELFKAETFELPKFKMKEDVDVFNFTWDSVELEDYQHGPKLTFEISV